MVFISGSFCNRARAVFLLPVQTSCLPFDAVRNCPQLNWTHNTHTRTHAHTYTHCWWHQIWTITVPEILWESISEWRQAKLRWDWCQTLLRVDLWHGNNKWHKCKMFLENSLIIYYIDQLHSSKNFHINIEHINSCRWKNLWDIRLFFALVEKCLMWKLCNSTPILYTILYICVVPHIIRIIRTIETVDATRWKM